MIKYKMTVYSQIAVVNKSTGAYKVSDAQGAILVAALNKVLPVFCNSWSLPLCTAVYVGLGKTTTLSFKVYIKNVSDISGTLGYHELQNNVPVGYAFVETVLRNGGVLFYSPDSSIQTFAQVLAHEVFEMIVDPLANWWTDTGTSEMFYPFEVSDPVQGNVVTVVVSTNSSVPGKLVSNGQVTKTKPVLTKVNLSDWVLPAWFNPDETKGPFNYNNTLDAPFTLAPGGYGIQMIGGSITNVFGMAVTEEQKVKLSEKKETFSHTKKMTSVPHSECHTHEHSSD